MPSQRGADDRVQIRDAGAPPQQLDRETRIGDQYRRITGPLCGIAARDRFAAERLGSPDHFPHRMAASGAEVECDAVPTGAEMCERAQMSLGEVLNMDVVADRRPVGGWIIGSVDVDLSLLAERRLQDERDEMRLGLVPFADLAIRIGACSIEITQRYPSQAVGLAVPAQRPIDRQLSLS